MKTNPDRNRHKGLQLAGEAENFLLMKCLRQIALFCFLCCTSIFCPGQSVSNLWVAHLEDYDCPSSPAVSSDGSIYIGTFIGDLFAFNPDGSIQWKFKTGLEIKCSPAVADDGTIYFGSRDRKFYALTPDGRLKWTFAAGAWIDSSPAIATNGTIYFGSWDTNFYALNPDGSLKWKFPSGGIIDSSPAIGADGTIYFGSHDLDFYALSPDGKLLWKFPTKGQITSSPAIARNGAIYFTSTDGNLYALNPDGTEQWQYHTGGASEASPIVGRNGDIYLIAYGAPGSHPYSFSPEGEKKWEWMTADVWDDTTPVALANGEVYFSYPWVNLARITSNGQISEFIREIGNIFCSPAVVGNGTFYFTCGRDLIAFTPTNSAPLAKSSWPMFRANPQHTGRVAVY